MTKAIGAILVAAMLNLGAAAAQSVLLSPTTSQAVNQPTGTTLSSTSLNGVAYVNPASSVDVVTQINTLSSNCSSTCVIHVPAGSYTTTARTIPITLQLGQSLVGDGQSTTTFTGNKPNLSSGIAPEVFHQQAEKSLTLLSSAALQPQSASTLAIYSMRNLKTFPFTARTLGIA